MDNIVVSSRIRLARNLHGIPYPHKLKDERAYAVVMKSVADVLSPFNYKVYATNTLSDIDCDVLLEKHLISKDLILNKEYGGVIISEDETVSIMINEEDHIRAQCLFSGFNLQKAYEIVNKIDDILLSKLSISYDSELGFLTACPTNIGTGMRASVMMFLPAITMNGTVNNVINALSKLGITIRGVYGEGSSADGYMYQVSNQISLGLTEQEIIKNVSNAVLKICEIEENARRELLKHQTDDIIDSACRAYGILTNAYKLDSNEFMKLMAKLKFGVCLGFIKLSNVDILDKLIISAQPAHLMQLKGELIQPNERDIFRAEYVAGMLKNAKI
ncbi:MAG: protein arginine kinase [Clostridia bacterium]|jgi:protein arginine kinase|nr:protein arginine kinase [Clostridia bacterium]MDD4275663.1 protein arginine kinase [Clostridia bacterium]